MTAKDAVIRVTSRIYYKGQRRERYINRARISENYFRDYPERVEWAVRLLSGADDYTTGYRFKAWRPAWPGTDGSDRGLHYVDCCPYNLDANALRFDVFEPDIEQRGEVWITRAWLESGFTAADRRRIYAALKQIAVVRHWTDEGFGRLHVLETGDLPGW